MTGKLIPLITAVSISCCFGQGIRPAPADNCQAALENILTGKDSGEVQRLIDPSVPTLMRQFSRS